MFKYLLIENGEEDGYLANSFTFDGSNYSNSIIIENNGKLELFYRDYVRINGYFRAEKGSYFKLSHKGHRCLTDKYGLNGFHTNTEEFDIKASSTEIIEVNESKNNDIDSCLALYLIPADNYIEIDLCEDNEEYNCQIINAFGFIELQENDLSMPCNISISWLKTGYYDVLLYNSKNKYSSKIYVR